MKQQNTFLLKINGPIQGNLTVMLPETEEDFKVNIFNEIIPALILPEENSTKKSIIIPCVQVDANSNVQDGSHWFY